MAAFGATAHPAAILLRDAVPILIDGTVITHLLSQQLHPLPVRTTVLRGSDQAENEQQSEDGAEDTETHVRRTLGVDAERVHVEEALAGADLLPLLVVDDLRVL